MRSDVTPLHCECDYSGEETERCAVTLSVGGKQRIYYEFLPREYTFRNIIIDVSGRWSKITNCFCKNALAPILIMLVRDNL